MSTLLSPTFKCVTKLKAASVVLSTIVMLGACQSQPSYVEQQSIVDFDYRKRHPIVITEAPENFDIPVAGEMRKINGSMKTAVAAFGQQASIDGNGFVEVLVPSGSGNEAAVRAVSPQIRTALKKGGVAADHIVMRSYAVSDMAASAPVRLSFMRVKGVVRDCGNWPNAMLGDNQNADYYNFGCATQANLAAMIDKPNDLLRPRPLGPGDPARTNVILTNNRSGAVTAGEYKTGVGATISAIGQN
ncbi:MULTISPECIES: CpaD family pilus assembly protein [Pseudovibrio]|uniref:Pilus assembly protein CpaD n=1 Tax=Pseudovibrio ascidiaceicola TaxID=285279 RepID=A0A1I3YTQ8_9HYPH|nr:MULTISPECIES: CpaD family pilus assembly protein [Pseudovibrio]KZL15668.1 Pilus biogenesis CpaD protein [Pseudovibrio sp. Ad26]SFK35287.1 pilus assembly protein CpaD [Pseudovibrio ascidiaceicola]